MNLQDQRMMMLLQQMRGGGQLNRQEGGSLMNPMQPQPPRNIQPPQMPMPPRIPPEGFGQMNRQEGMALQPNSQPQQLQPSIQNRSMDMFNEMDSMPEGNYQQRIQRHGLSPVGPDELFRRMREQGAIGGLLDPRR